MKNSTITYVLFAAALLGAIGYWYVTRLDNSNSTTRTLITSNEVRPSEVTAVPVSMTKEAAYEERQEENAEQKAKLDFVIENHQPQKLAASVTQVMKSSYQTKMDELKSAPQAVRVYDGQTYTAQGSTDMEISSSLKEHPNASSSEFALQGVPEKKTVVYRASVPRRASVVKSEPTPVIQSETSDDVFNTTTVVRKEEQPSPAQTKLSNESNVIKAAVFGSQVVKAGALLKFRLLEGVTIEGSFFGRNTFFSGICSIGSDRLLVAVDKFPIPGGGYKRVALTVHDANDFQEGLHAPSDHTKENAVDAAAGSVETIIGSVGGVPGLNLGSGVARIFSSAVNGTPKINVPDGHPVIFLTNAL